MFQIHHASRGLFIQPTPLVRDPLSLALSNPLWVARPVAPCRSHSWHARLQGNHLRLNSVDLNLLRQHLDLLLHLPLLLLRQEHLLDPAHLDPYVDGESDSQDECRAEDDVLDGVVAVLLLLDEEDAEVDEDDLLRQRQEGRDGEVPELDVAGRKDCRREVGRDHGEPDDEDDLRIVLELSV